jgi:hypothetical protein
MKLKRLTTKLGKAAYPWLTEPDNKFESQRQNGGQYHVDVILPAEEGEALATELEALFADWLKVRNMEQKEAGKKKLAPFATKPWGPHVDKSGEETGEWAFKLKRNAQWTDREGQVRTNVIRLVDSSGTGITEMEGTVGGGSSIKACFDVRGWASPLGIGIALDIVAVMIVELVKYDGNSDTDFGFASEEGGFTVEEVKQEAAAPEKKEVQEGLEGFGDF